jgi:hypothetical protein
LLYVIFYLPLTKTQFIYFFVAAGITLLFMNALNFLSRPKKTEGDYSRIAIKLGVVVALYPVASIVQTK